MSSLSLSVSGSPLLYHIFTALPLSGSSSRWALDLKILNESLQLYLKDKPSMHTTLRCCRNRALILSDFSLTLHDDQLKWVILFYLRCYSRICVTHVRIRSHTIKRRKSVAVVYGCDPRIWSHSLDMFTAVMVGHVNTPNSKNLEMLGR